MAKPKIAVFSGPTATIQNSEPLVTSNKAREKYGLPQRLAPDGSPMRFDVLRPQRLAAPVTVYIQQFSAHPLERDTAELYAPPDGYLDAHGAFHRERQGPNDTPVYEVTLNPEDGLHLLPYMARQANGQPWEEDCAHPGAPAHHARQPFYPDASRIFEEIDRFGVGNDGVGSLLSAQAEFEFYRAAPSGGYTKGLPAADRTDVGEGDVPPEIWGQDFFMYRPTHLVASPLTSTLARLTNIVQRAMASGQYAGGIWLEGSPSVEETTYWLSLLIDTPSPLVGIASQRAHGALSNDGDRNIVDAVAYIGSRIWADSNGCDEVGGVVMQDEQMFTARDVQKSDARPGGYVATGGHGGIVGSIGEPGPPVLTFKPVTCHTWRSAVRVTQLPTSVLGARRVAGGIELSPVRIKDERGELLLTAIPAVTIVKTARYLPDRPGRDPSDEVDILARMEKNLRDAPLAGFVAEGTAPFASMTDSVKAALNRAALSGMPVVRVGRGNAGGFTPPPTPRELAIAGSNLTATKARLLLMACLMKFGSPPPARDAEHPSEDEIAAVRAKLAEYQAVFDTH
jgi:hypothetical protein